MNESQHPAIWNRWFQMLRPLLVLEFALFLLTCLHNWMPRKLGEIPCRQSRARWGWKLKALQLKPLQKEVLSVLHRSPRHKGHGGGVLRSHPGRSHSKRSRRRQRPCQRATGGSFDFLPETPKKRKFLQMLWKKMDFAKTPHNLHSSKVDDLKKILILMSKWIYHATNESETFEQKSIGLSLFVFVKSEFVWNPWPSACSSLSDFGAQGRLSHPEHLVALASSAWNIHKRK